LNRPRSRTALRVRWLSGKSANLGKRAGDRNALSSASRRCAKRWSKRSVRLPRDARLRLSERGVNRQTARRRSSDAPRTRNVNVSNSNKRRSVSARSGSGERLTRSELGLRNCSVKSDKGKGKSSRSSKHHHHISSNCNGSNHNEHSSSSCCCRNNNHNNNNNRNIDNDNDSNNDNRNNSASKRNLVVAGRGTSTCRDKCISRHVYVRMGNTGHRHFFNSISRMTIASITH
jgi:hypothetical protein